MNRRSVLALLGAGGASAILAAAAILRPSTNRGQGRFIVTRDENGLLNPLPQSESEWKDVLTPEQFYVLRRKGTERAFTGAYWNAKQIGIYLCAACGQQLFSSDHKFDSGTGWPSYWQPIDQASVTTHSDDGFFMQRTEVCCSRCGGHLGHVFDDGPRPTGLRYCINSAAMKLKDQSKTKPADDVG